MKNPFYDPQKLRLSLHAFLICLLSLFCFSILHAQDNLISVKGKIASAGVPVSGATIQIKGSSLAVSADSSGYFHLRAPSDGTLVISAIGYATQELPIRGRTNLTIELDASEKSLGDVIVVGYGTQKKATL